jgi:hypothetical protein
VYETVTVYCASSRVMEADIGRFLVQHGEMVSKSMRAETMRKECVLMAFALVVEPKQDGNAS